MKQTPLFTLLIVLALAAGVVLRQQRNSPPPPGSDAEGSPEQFASMASGLAWKEPLKKISLPEDELASVIESALTRRYGARGLQHRAKAFALLSLLPPGQDLRAQWLDGLMVGREGWFDDHTGTIYLRDDLGETTYAGQASLARLSARALLWQHAPALPPMAHDEAWTIREAVHGGLAADLERRFLRQAGDGPPLPTSAEMAREGLLLSLPLYLHNLLQIGPMQGQDYVRIRRDQGESYADILAQAPTTTLALLYGVKPPAAPLQLPAIPGTLLTESLGCYGSQLLCERLGDYLTAESLGAAWRGDAYLYFSNETGSGVYWISRWHSELAAQEMADLLRREDTPPAPGEEPSRLRRVMVEGRTLRFVHGDAQSTLDELLPPPLPSPQETATP